MSRLLAAFTAIALIFGTIVFLTAMIPTMDGLMSAFTDAGAGEEEVAQMERVEMVVLRIAPTIFVIGALLFAYMSVASRQRYQGRGP